MAATRIEIIDPARPGAVPAHMNADIAWLASQGVEVRRFAHGQEPADFTAATTVNAAIQAEGEACLPLVLANGEIVSRGAWPVREQLAALAGIPAPKPAAASSCCSGGRCGG